MKTFNQFKHDMNEGKVNLLKGAIKFLAKGVKKYPVAGAVGMGAGTGINYLLIKNALKKRKPKLDKDSEKFLKTGEFQESVAVAAIKGGSKLVPALMTGIGAAGMILQSRKGKVPKDSEGMPDELAKLGRKAKVTLKKGMRDFKKGLAAGQEVPKQGAKGRFNNPNAQLVKDMMKKKAEKGDTYAKRFLQQIKDKRAKNKDIDKKIGK